MTRFPISDNQSSVLSDQSQNKQKAASSLSFNNFAQENLTNSSFVQLPPISLPKGGGALKGIEQKFQVNSATGSAALSIPLPLSPSRHNFVPAIALTYNSNGGNSAFGLGWNLSVPRITRKTEKLLPQYKDEEESDAFILSGAEDLVPLLENKNNGWQRYAVQKIENNISYTVKRYRPRIEGLFALIEKWKNNQTGETHWRSVTRDNVHSYYGLTSASRLSDPNDSLKVAEWLLSHTHDDKGNVCFFEYKKEDYVGIENKQNEKNRRNNCTQIYPKKILYGNRQPFYLGDTLPQEKDFLFKVLFDYGEHDAAPNVPIDVSEEKSVWACRQDPFSDYRAGFEIRTYRRCRRVLVFHCFDPPELPHTPYLTRSLELFYHDDLQLTGNAQQINGFSYLTRARQNGHRWNPQTNSYTTKFLPETELTYQPHEWNTKIETVTAENAVHAPVGINNKQYLWIDLFSEGVTGILTEQASGWFYKSNLGDGNFSPGVIVSPKPNFQGLNSGSTAILELAGNGVKYLVQPDAEPRGFFKLTNEDNWEPFKAFEDSPNLNFNNPNLRFLDLNGDGAADLLLTENDNAFSWYESRGEKGFAVSRTLSQAIDEEKGPVVVFADAAQTVFLADMNGDGLTDIVRIRNGEICYWANLGYGRFSSKVSMDNAPIFDFPDAFNPAYLRLADIDGSGTIDVIYLGKNDFRIWMNLNGNEWTSEPQIITAFPAISDLSDVAVLDFLGTGTACLVYSSAHAQDQDRQLQYIDLMNSQKPHLLVKYANNCGKEVSLEYTPSTKFYLADKKVGRKWITKLPFPVHCISKVKLEDKIRETVFTNSYRYSHGFYDYIEKEFRGFARVEQLDTEEFSAFRLNAAKNVVAENLHQPPVKTISWFHTGAFFEKETILHQLETEYFQNSQFAEHDLSAPLVTDDLSAEESREAARALKGFRLRSETYAADNSPLKDFPFVAAQSTVEIRKLQPKENNQHASFLVIPSESISYTYERNPADPRISHSFVLETDELGNVKKSASVIYPRMKRPLAPAAISDRIWNEQNKLHIVYGESFYTNDVIDESANVYRLRSGCEAKDYEISGIEQPAEFFFEKEKIKTKIAAASEILFEAEFTIGAQKRLLSHGRVYFLNDSLTAPLALGQLSSLGILHKNYLLAFTKNLVNLRYGSKVTDQMLLDAKYVHSETDEHWWTQSGTARYANDPKANFYLPVGARDVFGNESAIEYDAFNLLLESATDAIGNQTTAVNDYRTLAPSLVTDANLNRATVETDELGLIIKSAVMGKAGANEGDTLADPTVRVEYDLFNWKNHQKPNYVHSFAREKHNSQNTRWQESYAYSDGSGSAIMIKAQAKPGKAARWNPTAKKLEEIAADPRWIGNGRTIFNNKGNPIKQYEPFFSATHEYESEDALVETGITPIFYYDPIGRNIRTELPNKTFTRTEFDAWHSKSFDANDTVKESEWFAERGSPDPSLAPEPSDPEQRAAWLAAKHHATPATIYTDALGRAFYAVTDYGDGKTIVVRSETDLAGRFSFIYDQKNRKVAESYTNLLGAAIYARSAEKGEQWIFADVIGRLVKIWDNNLREMRTTYDKLHRPVSGFVKENGQEKLFTHVIYADHVFDAATAQNLNFKNRIFRIYDQAGSITIKKTDFKGNALECEQRLVKDYKTRTIDWSALAGLTNLAAIDTAADSLLETEVFTSSGERDALGRAVKMIVPGGTVYQPVYNAANQLDSLQVQLQGQGQSITFLAEQDYDAKGQRQFAKYGNNVVTRYFYEPQTRRLSNQITKLSDADADAQAIQNLAYTFDPVGNVVQIRDAAQQTHFFSNSVVSPENKFEYDAVYQLKQATGREHAAVGNDSQPGNPDLPFINQLPHFNNSSAVRNYTEKYEYDDCGNITRRQHIAHNGSWTQRYRYEYEDDPANNTNRLKATSAPGDADGVFSLKYMHDLPGNITAMPHLSAPDSLAWNFLSQLKEVNLGGGGTAFYVYATGGNRVRKVVERQGGLIQERIYLGAIEIYRERFGNNAPHLERQTIHIADDTGKIAQVDVKTIDANNSDPTNPLNVKLVRYQYGNHLGSAVFETDDAGNVISYEEFHPFGTSAYRVSKPGFNLSLKRYRFSGKERDEETGFYYCGARYYVAWLGRWTSSDPAGFVDGLNLYRYCRNSPTMLTDPSGYNPTDWGGNPSPDIAKTPGEAGRIGVINFANTHYVQAEEDGVRYRVQIEATRAEWVGTGADAHWTITEWRTISATPIPEDEEPEPDESGYEPIVSGGSGSEVSSNTIVAPPTPGVASGGNGSGNGDGNASGGGSPTTSPSDATSVGDALSLSGTGAERFIWEFDFPNQGLPGSRRGQILEWMLGNSWRSNTKGWDIETATSVQQIKSTSDFDGIGQIVRDATRDADAAITANSTGTMSGKRPQAMIVTPTDAPRAVDTDITSALGRARKPYANNPLPPEHVRGLPGGWGTAARGLGIAGTGLSGVSLVNDIRTGDVPMAAADTLSTVGGGLEVYALYSSGATVAGVSAMSAGLVLGGAGIALGSGISAYRAYQRGDTAGVVAGIVGVAAGLAIIAGVIFGAPLLLAAGIIGAIGVGLFHLGRWLFGD